ncbi:MAG: hypothetical protein EBR26_05060 [Microbacteriaceae bacterium]|nr:hypothetical protein [Microbacteriaceae bacterium]
MQTRKKVIAAGIAVATSLTLTACDPPIPPEILASLAEQSYTCVEGQATVAGPSSMQEVLTGWADYLSYSCVDPEPNMSFTTSELDDPNAQSVISEYAPNCKPELSVPLAIDAAVLVYQDVEVGSLNVSAKSLAGLLNGTITNWKQLAEDNPGTSMPDHEIQFRKVVDKVAFDAISNFLSFSKNTIGTKVLQPQEKVSLAEYGTFADGYWTSNLQEGELAIIPNSFAVQLGLYPANIFVGLDADGFPVVATPDVTGLVTGGTQWKLSQSESSITVTLDPKKEPTPPDGSDVAPPPYQAIYPLSLNLCKDDLLSRAIARFVLRLDNQGSLAGSNYAPLPEFVRIPALVKVSEGLPTPEPTASSE